MKKFKKTRIHVRWEKIDSSIGCCTVKKVQVGNSPLLGDLKTCCIITFKSVFSRASSWACDGNVQHCVIMFYDKMVHYIYKVCLLCREEIKLSYYETCKLSHRVPEFNFSLRFGLGNKNVLVKARERLTIMKFEFVKSSRKSVNAICVHRHE